MTSNSKENSAKISTDNAVLNGVLMMVDNDNWLGTMTDLNSVLVKVLGKKNSKMLPGSPGALRVVLNRIVNRLRSRGVSVRFGRTSDHTRTRYVKFSI